MSASYTISGHLRIPVRLLLDFQKPETIQAWLLAHGLLPPDVLRWRMQQDFESGGYLLLYEVTIAAGEEVVPCPPL